MDGLTSTYSKLHDAKVPLKERTELCRYILEGSDCFFPNKCQVLTDWLCQELQHLRVSQGKKDGEISLDVRKNQAELWNLLHEVLRSPLSEHIVVRQRFLAVLFDELTRSKNYFDDNVVVGDDDIMDEVYRSCALSVFLCCQDVLKNVQMALLLFNRLENIEQFLAEVLGCFLAMQSINSEALIEELCCLVTLVLQQYGTVQRQQVAQRKVFGNLCEKLLGLLLMVKAVVDDAVVDDNNSISNECNLQEARKSEITSKLDAVIAGGLFHKEHIMNYKLAVDDSKSDEPSSKKQRLSGYPSRLFEVLRTSPVELGLAGGKVHGNNQVTSELWWKSVCKSLPFLLKSFLEAVKDEQKLERSAKFNFFIELYNLIPLKGEIGSDHAIPQVDRIAILNQMLQVLLEYDVYQIAEDNLNGEPLFKWLVNLTRCLVQSSGDCDVLFQSLGTLLKLNHKIIEQFLEEIIEQCLVKSDENPEVVGIEKVIFFSNLVETYSKLHQVEHLMKQMLKVIENSVQDVSPIPVEVLTKLSQAFERYPLNLTLRLCQLFLDAMKTQTDYLKPITQGGDPNKGFNGTAMEAITVLFGTFLCNSSYSASDQHGLDPQKANALQQFIETTKVSVLTPLIQTFPVAVKFCQKEIGFCALYLLYALNKVTEYLNHHNVCTVDCGEVQISWSSECGTFLPNKSWAAVDMITKSGKLRFCTDLLAVQRARCLLASRKPDEEELACLLTFLYNFGDHHADPELGTRSWNADLCCITAANYPVAHWSLVARHAPLLLPHCGDPEIRGFAKNFLTTLSFGNKEGLQDDSLTVTQVSEKLLEANELLGLSSLQTAVVQEFWEIARESADKVAGGKFPILANVFAWSDSEGRSSENQDSEKEGTTGNDVMSVLDAENDKTEFQESSKVGKTRAENASGDSLESTKAELQYTTSLSEGLAKLMNDEAKMARKWSEKMKDKKAAKHSRCLHDIENLLGVLQRLSYPSFTSSNQTRCILSLLACDILAGKCASRVSQGSQLALQLSCRLSLNALIQGVLRLRDFTAWRAVDVGALLSWVHATMVPLDQALEMPKSGLHITHANVSNKLLGLLVKLALKSRRPAGLTAIRDFNDQLLASVVDEIAESDGENLEIVLTIVSTCAEFLQQKSLSKSSANTASAVIVNTAESLLDTIKLFLKSRAGSNDESCSNLEILVLRLSGIITRAIGLLSHSKYSENVDEHLRDWCQIVGLVISRVMPTLENEVRTPTSFKLVVTCVTVLEHISQFDTGCRDVLPKEFHTWILRICLEILRMRELPMGAVIDESKPGDDCERRVSELHEAILRLLSTLLEVDDGEHCTSLLGSLVDASVQGIDEEHHSKLLVGLSVFKKLLANKVVKKRKRDLRPILGNVLIAILNHAAAANLEVLTLLMEIIAGIMTLGSGTFYPQDLALVFQAFALACDAEVNDQRAFSRLFMARFAILSWTLFYYPDYVYGVIHVFLTCVRDLLSGLLNQGSKCSNDIDLATTVLASCGQKMARLYQEVASHKDVLSKYSSYILVDCIHLFSTQGIPGSIRDTLIEGVHCLFDVCSDDALTRVHVHLPSSERELFRSIKEDFNKHHKFKGNA